MHFSNRRSPSDCKYKCEYNSDGIYIHEIVPWKALTTYMKFKDVIYVMMSSKVMY